MKILLIVTLFLISVGGGESERVTGYSGGGVLIKCRYNTGYTSNQKYLCTGLWSNCADQIRTGVKNEWINSGRFSLFDDTRAAEFWVLIRELTVEDSGLYFCGVDIYMAIDIYTQVELNVKKDQDYEKSIRVIGHVGGSVNISCKYPQSHRSEKFLCRRVGTADCNYKTSVKDSKIWKSSGKFSLFDDGKQIFTVTINSLTEGDSGEYWCGAESDWTSDHGYKVYITQVNLRVTEQEPPATISSSSSPSSTIPQSTKVTTSPTSISTGNFSLKTNSSKASSVITVVSVILVLFLIGLFILAVRKRLRPQDAASTPTPAQPLRRSSSNYMDPVAVYSNIKDTRKPPDSDAGVSTVYSSASSLTNPTDPSQHIYGNDQLLTSPCEFSDPVYSNTQLPSSSFDKDVYTCPGVI